jgi:hypothetical protein
VVDRLSREPNPPLAGIACSIPETVAGGGELEHSLERFVVGRGKHAYVLPHFFTAIMVRCLKCGLENRVRRLAVTALFRCRRCASPLDI